MIRRCLGWAEPRHAPLILGEIAPLENHDTTDGMCPPCARRQNKAMDRVKLTAFFIGGRSINYVTDRLGAALRLRFARHLEGFKGHRTEAA